MSADQDAKMWQRIEDAFTPNAEELDRAMREIARNRLAAKTATHSVAVGVPARSRARRLAIATALLVTLSGLGWVGAGIVNQKSILEQLDFEQAMLNLNAEEDTELWRESMTRVSREVKMALHALHHMAQTPGEAEEVGTAARAALMRLPTNTTSRLLGAAHPIFAMWQTATSAQSPIAEKLRVVNNLEYLIAVGLRALRSSFPAETDFHSSSLGKLEGWLNEMPKYPKRNR